MPDVERSPSEPEDRRDGEVARRLLEVESFEEVEDPERDEQGDCEVERTQTTLVEVIGADQQDDRDRDCEGMKDVELVNGLDVQQEATTPAHVRRQRREKIDHGDRGSRAGDEEGERVGTPKRAQREW